MPKTTAQIAAKGLNATGVTDELARKWWDKLGSSHMAVVELHVADRTEGDDGGRSVRLTLTTVEPALDDDVTDHLRNLQRALYTNRVPPTLDGQSSIADVEQTPDQVIDAAPNWGDPEPEPDE